MWIHTPRFFAPAKTLSRLLFLGMDDALNPQFAHFCVLLIGIGYATICRVPRKDFVKVKIARLA